MWVAVCWSSEHVLAQLLCCVGVTDSGKGRRACNPLKQTSVFGHLSPVMRWDTACVLSHAGTGSSLAALLAAPAPVAVAHQLREQQLALMRLVRGMLSVPQAHYICVAQHT